MRCAAQLPVRDPGDRRDRRAQGLTWIDERLELVDDLEAGDLHRTDLADLRRARPEPGRLEVDDHIGGVLEQEPGAERRGERDRVAVPGEAGIVLDDLGK